MVRRGWLVSSAHSPQPGPDHLQCACRVVGRTRGARNCRSGHRAQPTLADAGLGWRSIDAVRHPSCRRGNLVRLAIAWSAHRRRHPPGTARAIRSIALAPPGVRDVGRLLSMYVRPDDALVTMDFDFNEGTAAADVALAMAEVGAGWSSACWRSTSWTRRGCSTCYRTLRAHGSMCSICRWATLTPPTCARRCDGSDDRPGWPH